MKKMFFVLTLLFSSYPAWSSDALLSGEGTPLQGMRGRPINLPDVSALGNITGYISDDKKDPDRGNLLLNEVETAFQGYIYPEMRADIIIAVGQETPGEFNTEICEAKASFLSLADGLSAEVGKIHLDFGKINKLHTHHLPTADRPLVLNRFFGEEELAGQGAAVKYLLPLPFYLQAQVGEWNMGAADPAAVDYSAPKEKTYTYRLNTSFELAHNTELEIGNSGLSSHGSTFAAQKDRVKIWGADATLKIFPSSYRKILFQNEWMHLKREIPSGTINRDGFYSLINYRSDKYWDFGLRFDYSESPENTVSRERDISLIVTRHLTETSYYRITGKHRNVEGENITEGWFQLSFGIGPHSHELE